MIKLQRIALLTITLCLFTILPACNDQTASKSESSIEQLLARASSYKAQGQYKAAMIETRNILQNDPDNAQAKLMSASINFDIGAYKEVVRLLTEIPEPRSIEANLLLIDTYLKMGKGTSAAAIITDLEYQSTSVET